MERWEREHDNGWIGRVTSTPDRLYTANANRCGVNASLWAVGNIGTLADAQRIADARIPGHACRCPGWRQVSGVRTRDRSPSRSPQG